MKSHKNPFRRYFYFFVLLSVVYLVRVRRVHSHDVKVRNEQRAMQNKELEEIDEDVPVRVEGLKDLDFKEVPLSTFRGSFVVVWADHNFQLFTQLMESLEKKRFAFPQITLVFAVPLEKENMAESEKLDTFRDRMKFEKSAVSEKWKKGFEVLLIDLEKNSGTALMEGDRLKLRRSFFYIIAPDGGVVDCAHIFSFQHERNLFKRIGAKISSSISRKGFKVE